MFSIFILTHNEERDIAACIESALLSDDVIVVDSCSSDRTKTIATQYPIRFIEHPFASHGQQRTWMLEHVPYHHDWAYILEADERMTPELFAECLDVIANGDKAGYYVAERVMFMGSWIRRSTQFPRYQLRLLRRGKVWFDDYGHTEREIVDGTTGFLQETYPHYTCSKGLSRWIDKHNRYSTDEAAETLRQLQSGRVDWRAMIWGKSEVERRRALKDLSLRLPLRPLTRWLYMMFILGGWRDGRAGLAWCTLQAFYEYLIVLKARELMHPEYLTGVQPEEPTTVSNSSQSVEEHGPVASGVAIPPMQ
ncbi:glycosyltransferase family 2 protein [Nodosilinea sp. FACHB-13]|uniref:glycosyltransferase family 2 protein n=1 Tax=Cyanophyceae TaxID=3028117 RepID=UPI00168614F1|nr:glycosyltransferase family 2 protein [Nodosilinea sp. FACHB-13]MBD2105720.1 glycosyltransferase family 2 protein [Nodosilinea sp. FACHB-13]